MRYFVVLLFAASAAAQDLDWVRDWENAQRARPSSITSVARIAPPNEKGTPLVVHGRLQPPKAGVIVFGYHTDATGVYNKPGVREWRLKGWAKTDAGGRFEFRTIRPAAYPSRNPPPAHIHFTVDGPGLSRRWVNELEFTSGTQVSTRNGVQHVNITLAVTESGRF